MPCLKKIDENRGSWGMLCLKNIMISWVGGHAMFEKNDGNRGRWNMLCLKKIMISRVGGHAMFVKKTMITEAGGVCYV